MKVPRLKSWEYNILTISTNNIFNYFEGLVAHKYKYQTYAYDSQYYLVMGPEDLTKAYVCLVAHVDTVGDITGAYSYELFLDLKTGSKIRSCGNCCLDDRLGVRHIVAALEAGYTPAIILLKEEELGCGGAMALTEDYPKFETLLPEPHNIQCLIEVDRKGTDEVVFYELDYPEFEWLFFSNYAQSLKYAFTDVCVLGPAWDIAIANVSAGYRYEHTNFEETSFADIATAEQKLLNMLDVFKNGSTRFPYKGSYSLYTSFWLSSSEEEVMYV